MSSSNVFERLFKLSATIAKLVMDGKRDPEKVADVLQTIVDEKTSAVVPAEPPKLESLLEIVGTATVSATTSKFVARKKFVTNTVTNTKRNAPVKINYLGDDFTEWFLNGDGKTEDPISEQTLRYAKLRKASVDDPIVEELGGKAKAETTLTEMFSLMEKQGAGEDGRLLTNGWANIFYIRDRAGVLRTVSARWCGDGWRVYAFATEDPGRWHAGDQVFSRNSALDPSATVVASS